MDRPPLQQWTRYVTGRNETRRRRRPACLLYFASYKLHSCSAEFSFSSWAAVKCDLNPFVDPRRLFASLRLRPREEAGVRIDRPAEHDRSSGDVYAGCMYVSVASASFFASFFLPPSSSSSSDCPPVGRSSDPSFGRSVASGAAVWICVWVCASGGGRHQLQQRLKQRQQKTTEKGWAIHLLHRPGQAVATTSKKQQPFFFLRAPRGELVYILPTYTRMQQVGKAMLLFSPFSINGVCLHFTVYILNNFVKQACDWPRKRERAMGSDDKSDLTLTVTFLPAPKIRPFPKKDERVVWS